MISERRGSNGMTGLRDVRDAALKQSDVMSAREGRLWDEAWEAAVRDVLRRTDACFSRAAVCDELAAIRRELDNLRAAARFPCVDAAADAVALLQVEVACWPSPEDDQRQP